MGQRFIISNFDKRNNAASPSPVADERNLYVFFPEFGLLSYTHEGKERWRLPLEPFSNLHGMASSPILAGNKLLLACDQDTNAYLLAEAITAVEREAATTLADILVRRTRVALECGDGGRAAARRVGEVLVSHCGWDPAVVEEQTAALATAPTTLAALG